MKKLFNSAADQKCILCCNSNRGQDPCKDRDTPDSFVPSSSPESVVGMEISRYPDLSLVKAEPPSPCVSPVLPMLPPPAGKGMRTVSAQLQISTFVDIILILIALNDVQMSIFLLLGCCFFSRSNRV